MGATTTPGAAKAQWDKIVALIGDCESIAADDAALEAKSPAVSEWNVGQHAEHAARTLKSMAMLVEMGMMPVNNPALKPAGFMGKVVLATGYIPRGKGKAPAPTLPKGTNPDEIRKEIASSRSALNALEKKLDKIAAATGLAGHPMLGGFTSSQWLRFMEIHTRHHLKIIADIRKKAK